VNNLFILPKEEMDKVLREQQGYSIKQLINLLEETDGLLKLQKDQIESYYWNICMRQHYIFRKHCE